MGKIVTRDGLQRNERALIHAINHVGSRVSVNALHMHLMALYEFMAVPIDSTIVAVCCSEMLRS